MKSASPVPPTDALDLPLVQRHHRAPHAAPADALTLALSQESSTVPAHLGQRLNARVAAHRLANAAMTTLRHPLRRTSEDWPGGARAWPLSPGSSWRVLLPPHTPLWTTDGAHELLVVAGSLVGPSASLSRHGHAVAGAGTAWHAGPEGVDVYLRAHHLGPFGPPTEPILQPFGSEGWQPLRPGVTVRLLHADGGAVSLFARFDAGARVPGHPHGVAEECLMLEGDLFLGDLLLPTGGFQSAPAGSQHGDLVADAPCLLFFHGAIDPAAVDNGHRAALGWPAL